MDFTVLKSRTQSLLAISLNSGTIDKAMYDELSASLALACDVQNLRDIVARSNNANLVHQYGLIENGASGLLIGGKIIPLTNVSPMGPIPSEVAPSSTNHSVVVANEGSPDLDVIQETNSTLTTNNDGTSNIPVGGSSGEGIPIPASLVITQDELDATERVVKYKSDFDKKQSSLIESIKTDETGLVAAEYNQSVKTEENIDSSLLNIKSQQSVIAADETLTPGEQKLAEIDLLAKDKAVKKLGEEMATMTAEEQQNVEKFFDNAQKDPEGTKKWMIKQEKIDQINKTPNVSRKVKDKAIAAVNSGNNSSVKDLISIFKVEEQNQQNKSVMGAAAGSGGVSGMLGVAGGVTPTHYTQDNNRPSNGSSTPVI